MAAASSVCFCQLIDIANVLKEEAESWHLRHEEHGAIHRELVHLRAAHARLTAVAKRDADRVEKLTAAVERLEGTGVDTADREAALRVEVRPLRAPSLPPASPCRS